MSDFVPSFKKVTCIVYIVEILASIIMLAFVSYETGGDAGHYRTAINQLLSCGYGGVRLMSIPKSAKYLNCLFQPSFNSELVDRYHLPGKIPPSMLSDWKQHLTKGHF